MPDSVANLVRRWWTQEFEHVWAFQYMRAGGLLRSQQIVVGVGCLLFGLSGTLSLPVINPWVRDGIAAWVALIAITVSSCVLAVLWWTHSRPRLVVSGAFIAYADVAVVTVMAMYRDAYQSMPGLILLTAVSVYTVMHHGAHAVMAQTVATLAATIAWATWAGIQGGTPVVNVVIRSLMVVPVTVCIPLLLVPLVATLRRDANGSFRDDTTGLHNRRGMQVRAGELIDRGAAFSLLLIDVDRFKGINDRFGHAAGDNALAVVAEVMRRIAPSDAVVARIGGDEFAIVLEGDHPMAARLAEGLHHSIAAESVTGAVPRMTVSIGIATVPPDLHGDALFVDLDQVLLRADRAMYAAKHDGGARTVRA